VRATDAAVLDVLDGCLGSARRVGSQERPIWEFSLDVGHDRILRGGKVAHGIHSLHVGCMRVFRGRGLDVAVGRLIASMRDLACSAQNEFLRVRAGGVVFGARALLLPSAPEPHLSALVALLVRRGGRYLGDELVKIDPVLRRAHPVRLPLLVDVRDLPMFPELEGRVVVSSARRRVRDALSPRHAITLSELGGREAEAAEVGWFAFPRFDAGAETIVRPIGASEALFRLAQASLNLHVWEDRGLRLMEDVLSSALIAEVVVGSLPEGADAVTSWLGSAA
jgi:hypothetical protein